MNKITRVLIANRCAIAVRIRCYAGYLLPPFYDSLPVRLIVHAPSRTAAIEKMAAALSNFSLGGIDTTIPFLRFLIQRPDFAPGKTHIRWVEELISGSLSRIRLDTSPIEEKV